MNIVPRETCPAPMMLATSMACKSRWYGLSGGVVMSVGASIETYCPDQFDKPLRDPMVTEI